MDAVASIFAYAWWCVSQSHDSGLGSSARVFFYEDLPVYSDTRDKVAPFLTFRQYSFLRDSLLARIDEKELARLFPSFETPEMGVDHADNTGG